MNPRLPLVPLCAALVVLGGCPDPNAVAEGAPSVEQPPLVEGGAPPPGAPPIDPGAGPPPTGEPVPPPSGEAGSTAGRPAGVAFQVEPGKGVRLAGTVSYAGSASGTLRIDFLKNPAGATFPELVHTLSLPAPGPWSVEAPVDLGEVSIVAFLDANDDGPGAGEPAGMIERTTVGSAAMSNLDITLSDTPELGALKPGAGPGGPAHPGGAVPPPPGDAPPAPGDAPAGAAPALPN